MSSIGIGRKIRVAIGGISGYLGNNLARALDKSGRYEIYGISRSYGNKMSPNLNIKGLMTWRDIDEKGFGIPLDIIVNLAGSPLIKFPLINKEAYYNELRASRINTNKILVKCINNEKDPPKLFLSASGISYYPSERIHDHPFLSEDYHRNIQSQNMLQKLASDVENSCKLNEKCPTKVYNARFGAVLGNGSHFMTIIESLFKLQLCFTFGDPNAYFHWIHVEDVCRALIMLFDSCDTNKPPFIDPGPINFVSNYDEKSTNLDLAEAFEKKIGNRLLAKISPKLIGYLFTKDLAESLFNQQNMIKPSKLIKEGFIFSFSKIYDVVDSSID